MPVEERNLADAPGKRGGQLAAGIRASVEDVGDRIGALVAREPGRHHRGAALMDVRASARSTGDQDQNHRCPRGQYGAHEFLLHSRQVERRSVTTLTRCAIVDEPRLVAHDHHADVRERRNTDRFSKPASVVGGYVTPSGMRQSRTEAFAERFAHRPGRRLRAVESELLGQRYRKHVVLRLRLQQALDMREVAVVTEEVALVICVRTDHGNAVDRGAKREGPVVAQQDDAFIGDATRQSLVLGVVEDRVAAVGVDIGRVEEAKFELGAQHPANRAIEVLDGDTTRAHRVDERIAEAVGRRQLDIETDIEGDAGGVHPVFGQLVVRLKLADGEVVRHHDSLETLFGPQRIGEELFAGPAWHTVEFVVAVHDRTDAGHPDHRLERMEVHLTELALGDLGRRPVQAAV